MRLAVYLAIVCGQSTNVLYDASNWEMMMIIIFNKQSLNTCNTHKSVYRVASERRNAIRKGRKWFEKYIMKWKSTITPNQWISGSGSGSGSNSSNGVLEAIEKRSSFISCSNALCSHVCSHGDCWLRAASA